MTADLPSSSPSGQIDAKIHYFPLRVYYAETDAGGVVYHAAYLNFAERARIEFLRLLGHDIAAIADQFGLIFAVRHCDIDYKASARLDDALLIETQITELGGASVQFRQVINRQAPAATKALVTLNVTLVAINKDGKACRIPDFLREKFKDCLPT